MFQGAEDLGLAGFSVVGVKVFAQIFDFPHHKETISEFLFLFYLLFLQ